MPKPYEISAEEAAVKIRTQELIAEEYVASVFNRITQIEKRINAFITLTKQTALQTARQIDEKIRKGEKLGCLAGIPIAVKDNICTRDHA